MKQLDLFQSKPLVAPYQSANLPNHKSRIITHWTGEYDTARGRYYRYYWQFKGDRSPKHAHIRGSVVGSLLGDYRCGLVDEAIANGRKPAEIVEMIRRFPRSTRNCRYPNFETVTRS